MTNMEKVAEMLGVEIGDKLKIEGSYYTPHILHKFGLFDSEGREAGNTLTNLINGDTKFSVLKEKSEPKITIVTQVCEYCGEATNIGFSQIIKDCEIQTICDECLKEQYGVTL